MEDLIELVAASFARHGIDCRPTDPRPAISRDQQTSRVVDMKPSDAGASLPEHNFRKIVQGDPSP